ncbi:MAG: HIT family protein [Acidimicrobiales bacterium]
MSFDPTCPFCDIARGAGPAHVVYEDEHSMAFLDIAPAAEGHTLVIPRTHARTLLDIAPASAATLMSGATQVARLIDRTFHPDGMTMVQANERAGGQTVFHVHLHLVPRWNGDPLFRPWIATRAPTELLSATHARMVAAGSG